jgi:hypothetical protein
MAGAGNSAACRSRKAPTSLTRNRPLAPGAQRPTSVERVLSVRESNNRASPARPECIARKCCKRNKSIQIGLGWRGGPAYASHRTVCRRIDPCDMSPGAGSHFARCGRADLVRRHVPLVELEDWREQLPAGSRHDVFRAFRQALSWAVERDLASRNASNGIRNPKRKRHERREVLPFESWAEVEAVADELDSRYRAIPFVAVGCGLRPEELFGLERRDIDRTDSVLHVRRRRRGEVPTPRMDTCPTRRGYRSQTVIRLPPHLRNMGDRGRH